MLPGRHISLSLLPALIFYHRSGIAATPSLRPSVEVIPFQVQNISSEVQFTYPGYGLDGPKVHPINSTTFDWWYFDAVSASGDLASVVINFYTASPGGFEALTNTSTVLETSISGSFANGTTFIINEYPSEAVVITEGDGSAGRWGEYSSWKSTPDLKNWEIRFDAPEYGVKACMTLESVAPAHLPCGIPKDGEPELLMPHIGWANAVPDAKAKVDFEIGGVALAFTGPGYHDKNWSDQPFFNSVSSWYWGHGHLGPYSIIWFDARDITGAEHFSSYVAKDGELLAGSCGNGSVLVRPWGGDATYPPTEASGNPDGFVVTFAVDGKDFSVNVTNKDQTVNAPGVYSRWVGTVSGGFEGGERHDGVAQYEEFKV